MQGGRVLDLNYTGGMADCGQGLVSNFDRHRIGVNQIETVEELLAGVFLRGKDRELKFQKLTVSVLGWLHFRSSCHANIPAGRLGFGGDTRCYLTGVKIKSSRHLSLLGFVTVDKTLYPLVPIEYVETR